MKRDQHHAGSLNYWQNGYFTAYAAFTPPVENVGSDRNLSSCALVVAAL
jgi:hypothetical protein